MNSTTNGSLYGPVAQDEENLNSSSPRPGNEGNTSFCTSKKAKIGLILMIIVIGIGIVIGLIVAQDNPEGQLPENQSRKIWRDQGTTANFSEVVLDRCESYTQAQVSDLSGKDCQKILKTFKKAFLSKDPCAVTEQDYEPLMNLTKQTIKCDKVLLWSKTKQLGHQPEPAIWNLITLEGMLLGFMIDSLTWCGDEGSSELNYESCPDWEKDCKDNAVSVLWKLASKKFAESACGVVTVMLNGSLSQAYDNSSILGRVEISNLDPGKVTNLMVWVKHDQDSTFRDRRGKGLLTWHFY